jgi:PhnB protein
MDFYKQAFGAEEMSRLHAPDGRIMHGAMKFGQAMVFVADDFKEYCGGMSQSPLGLKGTPVTLHQYVPSVDQAIDKAVAAGATVVMPAMDMFWGDRYGVIQDPFGHKWSLATHLRDLTPAEIEAGMKEAFSHGVPETAPQADTQ